MKVFLESDKVVDHIFQSLAMGRQYHKVLVLFFSYLFLPWWSLDRRYARETLRNGGKRESLVQQQGSLEWTEQSRWYRGSSFFFCCGCEFWLTFISSRFFFSFFFRPLIRRSSWPSYGFFWSSLLLATWPSWSPWACPARASLVWIISSNISPLPVQISLFLNWFYSWSYPLKLISRFKCRRHQRLDGHCVEDHSGLARGKHCLQSYPLFAGRL